MKQKTLFLILLIGISCNLFSQERLKVLFVGNSYTYANDLPDLIERLSHSVGKSIESTKFLSGGAQFATHWNNNTLKERIMEGGFDFMVIQGQSQEVAFPYNQFMNAVYPYAKKLDSLFKSHNHNGQVVFFMTWGYRYGDQSNCPNYPPFCNYWTMSEELCNNYTLMATDFNSSVAEVGKAWQYSMKKDSTFVLHSPDNSHPHINGSYLAACVIYSKLFNDSINSSFHSTLSVPDAERLQQISNRISFGEPINCNVLNASLNSINQIEAKVDVSYLKQEERVNIKIDNISDNAEILIYDIKGIIKKRITAKPILNNINTSIDVKDFALGVYLIRINSSSLSYGSKMIFN